MTRALAAVALAVAVSVALAADPIPGLSARVKDSKREFESKKKQAAEEVMKDFDKLIATTRKTKGLLESARKDKIAEHEAAKKAFKAEAKFPEADEYALIELKYYQALHKGYRPLAKLVEEVFAEGNKNKNTEILDAAQKLKNECEKLLPESAQLTAETRWTGRLLYGNTATPFTMEVTKKKDTGLFTARCNYTGIESLRVAGATFEVEGQQTGIGFEAAVSKIISGTTRFRATGVIAAGKFMGLTNDNNLFILQLEK